MSDLSGLPVKCPQCKRVMFHTTDKFDPALPPNGSMVRFLKNWHLDWLCVAGTKASEMTCPECLGQLAHGGNLLVMVPPHRIPEVFKALHPDSDISLPQEILDAAQWAEIEDGNLSIAIGDIEWVGDSGLGLDAVIVDCVGKPTCPICGKECKNELGLNSHMRSHAKDE